MLKLKETSHKYYCNLGNYYVSGRENNGCCEYDTWLQFKDGWLDNDLSLDDDYNHLFRFDISENEEMPGVFSLYLFFILQRIGNFKPVIIHNITQDDMPEIETFLAGRWEYMKNQWEEFSKEK